MKSTTRSQIEQIENLALYVKRFDTEELWDSEASIEAENALYDAVRAALDAELFEAYENYCLKATLSERAQAAIDVVRGQVSL